MPYIGWVLGTLLGALINSILPESLQIALYCMFIAIVVPPAKKSKPICFCIAIAVMLSCILYYVPYLKNISMGLQIIIASVISAILSAVISPIKSNDENKPVKYEESQNAELKLMEEGNNNAD